MLQAAFSFLSLHLYLSLSVCVSTSADVFALNLYCFSGPHAGHKRKVPWQQQDLNDIPNTNGLTHTKKKWNNLSRNDAFSNNYVGAHPPIPLSLSAPLSVSLNLAKTIKEKLMTNAIAMHSNDITIITLTLIQTHTHMRETGDKRICFDIKLNAN